MAYIVYATVQDLQRHFSYSSLQKLSQIEPPAQNINGVDIPIDTTLQLFADLASPSHQALLEDLIKSACTKINRALRPRYGKLYSLPFVFASGTDDDTTETLRRWCIAFAAQELLNRPGSKLEMGQKTFLQMHYDECKSELDRVAQSIDDLDLSSATAISTAVNDPITLSSGTEYGSAFGEVLRTVNNGVTL